MAPLLPKLRGQLAEFLNDSSPAHLSLLSQSTCVGFGYGRSMVSLEAFPGSPASIPSLASRLTPLDRHPSAGVPSSLRHSFSHTTLNGTGLATCCPSATPLGLALGPALPWADQPSPGTLGLSVSMILAYFSLLMPTFSLLFSSHSLTAMLPPEYNAPLPIMITHVPELRCHV